MRAVATILGVQCVHCTVAYIICIDCAPTISVTIGYLKVSLRLVFVLFVVEFGFEFGCLAHFRFPDFWSAAADTKPVTHSSSIG